jgi:hypothetical protein
MTCGGRGVNAVLLTGKGFAKTGDSSSAPSVDLRPSRRTQPITAGQRDPQATHPSPGGSNRLTPQRAQIASMHFRRVSAAGGRVNSGAVG